MKKWTMFMLIIGLAILFTGCKQPKDPNDDKVTSVTISNPIKTEITVAEQLQLIATVNPTDISQDVIWTSSNTDVMTIDVNGLVTGIEIGSAVITATSKLNPTKSNSITLTVVPPVDDPESVEISGTKTEVSLNRYITLIAIVSPSTASQEVFFSSSDEVIASVDSDGKVTGHQLGSVIITVTVVADTTITDSYNVEVVEVQGPGGDLDPTDIVIQGETQVKEGSNITLTASVLPTGSSQNVTWVSSHETIATISDNGVITAIKEGDTYITVTSQADPTIFSMIKISVIIDSQIDDYPDLGGYVIEIMASTGHSNEHNPFDELYGGLDKLAKQTAWLEVEQLFNCDIQIVDYPVEAPWGPPRQAWLNQQAALNNSQADIIVSTTEWLKTLVDGNSLVDTSSFYQLYGENQMPAALKSATTYKEGLYGLLTSDVGALNVDKGMYYNIALIDSLGLDSPAKLFNDGEWTYSGFEAYVQEASALLNDDQSVLSGKPVLYWIGMTHAAGVKLVDTVTLSINFDNQYAVDAGNVLRDIYVNYGWGDMGWDALVSSFNDGNSIFQAAEYWFIKSADRWKSDMWDEGGNSLFGYVPFPYPDNIDRSNTRTSGGDGQCYMMSAGRQYPGGVTAENVYWAFTEMMIRTGEELKDDPSFDEETLMRTSAEKKLDDTESVTAIVFFTKDKVMFDPIYGIYPYATYLSPALEAVVRDGADYSETLDNEAPKYRDRMLELYS